MCRLLTVLLDRLAQRIVEGDVPQALMNRKVHSLYAHFKLHLLDLSLSLSLFVVFRGEAALSITCGYCLTW